MNQAKHTDMNSILKELVTSDIYDSDDDDVDCKKLESYIHTQGTRLGFLLDHKVYGIGAVAFLIRCYRHLEGVSKLFQASNSLERKEVNGNEHSMKCNRKKKKKDQGGSEVFKMFTSPNNCVIDQAFMDYMRGQATAESTTDYYKNTHQGTHFHNGVEEDIQLHMDLYCNGHKSIFSKDKLLNASKNMKVYIKIMYYVQRGLITPWEYGDHKYVNAYWGKIGGYFLHFYKLQHLYIYCCTMHETYPWMGNMYILFALLDFSRKN